MKAFEANQKALVEAYEACSSTEEFFKLKHTKLAPLSKKLEELDSTMGWTYSRVLCNPAGPPKVVAVTGAGTDTGAEALYRIAAGEMLGGSTPVTLQVSGADPAVLKDLQDCAFPCLAGVTAAASPAAAVKGAAMAILLEGDFASVGSSVGAQALVAVKGMANASAVAAKAPKTATVTGITRTLQASTTPCKHHMHTPCTTERSTPWAHHAHTTRTPLAQVHAPPPTTTTLQASAEEQIADKVGCPAAAVSKVVVWGDSAIDVSSATVEGKWAVEVLQGWTPEATEPSATVGADAIVSHMKDLALVTPPPTPPPPPCHAPAPLVHSL